MFFVSNALGFSTTYYMPCGLPQGVSCGVSFHDLARFVEFFSSRECHRSWIFFYGVFRLPGFSVVVGKCLVFVIAYLGLLGVDCRGSCTLAFLTRFVSLCNRG